jgi:hypothetical protein
VAYRQFSCSIRVLWFIFLGPVVGSQRVLAVK